MGNGGGSSGLSSSRGDREHFGHKTTNEQVQDFEMSNNDKVRWLEETLGISQKEAREIVEAVNEYTGGDFSGVHSGENKEIADKIDKFLNNKKAPVYAGEIFRGLVVEGHDGRTGEDILHDIIKTGTWREPGISSFSSDRKTAESFMRDFGKGNIPVLLRNTRNRSGVPIAHMSKMKQEFEVITPSSVKNRGFKITGFKKIPNWWDGGYGYMVDIQEN